MNLADLLNTAHEIEYEGKKYLLHALTKEDQARYARRLESRARSGVARDTELPEAERAEFFRTVSRDIASGVYEWGGVVCLESLRTPTGISYALHLMLAHAHPEVTEDFAAKLYEAKIVEIASILASASNPDDFDPKAQARPGKATRKKRSRR